MRGKEVYFAQNATEVTFSTGMQIKLMNPDWDIKTDDWGYFYRAYSNYMSGTNKYWRNYDAFLGIVITTGICGMLWLFGNYHDFKRLSPGSGEAPLKVYKYRILYRES